MDIDSGLKIRVTISALLALVLLAIFVERLSYPQVIAAPRDPSSVNERVLEACETQDCTPKTANKD